MTEREPGVQWQSVMVEVTGGVIAAQATGSPTDPVILLIGGATWSRDWWAEDFCGTLADQGLRVIRYDTRDTGESIWSPPGEPAYTGEDLTRDAAAILDAFDARTATIAGLSMGGRIAQEIAALHPDRVAALVLMSTSPVSHTGVDLPGPSPEVAALFANAPPEPDWSDRETTVSWVVDGERPYAGPGYFDEAAVRDLVARVWDRTPSMASAFTNHFMIASSGPSVDLNALRGIPTLVVHGSADPLFPPAHGRALATALDAPLLMLDGVGHQTPPRTFWPELVTAIARLTERPPGSHKGTP
ncbi:MULTISPECIES: alpha/beta fold hydrolase [unclassified Arthrobacter]|uniref:alpha/beta fold hydrolase n=1 Tax=unclassified Arthrobacter TaxID=235627 RepID=UPI0019624E92|nr:MULTISPECIES: alpha/beta hydrolase [unclassified Arthrobacter]